MKTYLLILGLSGVLSMGQARNEKPAPSCDHQITQEDARIVSNRKSGLQHNVRKLINEDEIKCLKAVDKSREDSIAFLFEHE